MHTQALAWEAGGIKRRYEEIPGADPSLGGRTACLNLWFWTLARETDTCCTPQPQPQYVNIACGSQV